MTKTIMLDFAGTYAELVLGHKSVPSIDPSELSAMAENWFDGYDPAWHEIDNVFHDQMPTLTRGQCELRITEDGVERTVVDDLVAALEGGLITHTGRRRTIPNREDDLTIGVMAWERFRGVLSFPLEMSEPFDLSKLSLEITQFNDMCDLVEDEWYVSMVTSVSYAGKALEWEDVSGWGKGSTVMFRLNEPDPDIKTDQPAPLNFSCIF